MDGPHAKATAQLNMRLPHIVAVKGEDGSPIQALLSHLAASWRARGLRIAGVVEECKAGKMVLRDLKSGVCHPLKQDLGPGSTSCSLDAAGLAAACFSVETAIEAGCDAVILSKFGKMEALGGGLAGAFYAAIAADRPIVTSVSPSLIEAWGGFAGPLAMFIEPDYDAIEAWRLAYNRAACLISAAPNIMAS
jgi:hypothetical protein